MELSKLIEKDVSLEQVLNLMGVKNTPGAVVDIEKVSYPAGTAMQIAYDSNTNQALFLVPKDSKNGPVQTVQEQYVTYPAGTPVQIALHPATKQPLFVIPKVSADGPQPEKNPSFGQIKNKTQALMAIQEYGEESDEEAEQAPFFISGPVLLELVGHNCIKLEGVDKVPKKCRKIIPLNLKGNPSSEYDLDNIKGFYHLKFEILEEMTTDLQKVEKILKKIKLKTQSQEDIIYFIESNARAEKLKREFMKMNQKGPFCIQNLPILSKYVEVKNLLSEYAKKNKMDRCYKVGVEMKVVLAELYNCLIYKKLFGKENIKTKF